MWCVCVWGGGGGGGRVVAGTKPTDHYVISFLQRNFTGRLTGSRVSLIRMTHTYAHTNV